MTLESFRVQILHKFEYWITKPSIKYLELKRGFLKKSTENFLKSKKSLLINSVFQFWVKLFFFTNLRYDFIWLMLSICTQSRRHILKSLPLLSVRYNFSQLLWEGMLWQKVDMISALADLQQVPITVEVFMSIQWCSNFLLMLRQD